MPTENPTILILDDDPVLLKILETRIQSRFPDATVETRSKPIAVGVYDIYILDNDFQGRSLAADLAEEIKKNQPDSMVAALSGTLCATTLKRLVNCGCDGAFDKSDPTEIDALIRALEHYLNKQQESSPKSGLSGAGLLETTRAISNLIRDWNHRLEIEERRDESEARSTSQGVQAS